MPGHQCKEGEQGVTAVNGLYPLLSGFRELQQWIMGALL